MKQFKILSIFILLFMLCITLTACDLFSSDTTKYTTKLESITGKWYNQDDESTYLYNTAEAALYAIGSAEIRKEITR